MKTLEKVWNKSNEYWIPKNIFLAIYNECFLTLEKLINDSLMDLKWHNFGTLFKLKSIYDSIMQHFCESKKHLKDFVKLTNRISLWYFGEYFRINNH